MRQREYRGRKTEGMPGNGSGYAVDVFADGEERGPLPLRIDVLNVASAFGWGYPGGGPAQLAFAILADYLLAAPDDLALAARAVAEEPGEVSAEAIAKELYAPFRDDLISPLASESGWTMSGDAVHLWLYNRAQARMADAARGGA